MEVVANSYLPGDQRLVDKIVYELKAQGIFDQFRKECFADVDTKPAYQNLRQRVEGSVSGFLKEQSWRPDMNKNQVREMLRKRITESGYLETGVERIVDQVVNPKINSVFLPKVEEIVYNYLGIKKPSRTETSECDLLPNDLEAVSPESESLDKKDDKSADNIELEESKAEEDESPPFEPLEEQTSGVPQEENSVDSHLSGFSGLASHESNSYETKTVVEQDSQMSRNSSDSRLSIVTSDENSKMEICEDSQSKSIKSTDSNSKPDDKKTKSSDKHRSRSEKDRRSNKDSRSRHSSSSKDKDKSRDRKDSRSKSDKDRDKDKDRKSSSSSKHSSHSSSRDKDAKKDSKGEKDKDKNHKDSKGKDKSSDSKSRDKHRHSSSSSSHTDKYKKDKEKDKKKETKSKDDHYSSKDKKNDRRSTDRDSSDGQSGKPSSSQKTETNGTDSQKTQESTSSGGDSGNSNNSDNTTKAPLTDSPQKVKVLKPKCASNIQEALRLRKIRKQLAKLEKKNQLSLASVDVNSPILMSASINFDDLGVKTDSEPAPTPLQNTVISQDNWDAMEAKLRQEVDFEFKDLDETNDDCDCKYFDEVDLNTIEFIVFVREILKKHDTEIEEHKEQSRKRKIDIDVKNNNNKVAVPEKRTKLTRKRDKVNSHVDKFSLPLSPAESDKSVEKKEEAVVPPLKIKRNSINKINSQRYSSDDLYKPRPTFASSRRRGAKNLDN